MKGIGQALALMGAGASGYMKGANDKEDRDQIQKEKDFQNQQRQREADMQAAVQEASKTVSPTQVAQTGELTVGENGPELAQSDAFKVGTQQFGNRAAADSAAADQNSSAMRVKRMADAVRPFDPLKANQIEQSSIQTQAAQQQMADQQFVRGASKALMTNGFEGLADWMSASPADGQGGKMKFKATRGPDGKTVLMTQVDEQGNPVGKGMEFTDDEAGHVKALSTIMALTNPADRVKHYEWEQSNELAKKRADNEEKYRDRMAGVAEKNAETNAQYRSDIVDAKNNAAGDKNELKMHEADKLELSGIEKSMAALDKSINDAKASGMWKKDDEGAKDLNDQRATLQARADKILARYREKSNVDADPAGLREEKQRVLPKGTLDKPAIDVTGDPKAFLRQLYKIPDEKERAIALRAFDESQPGASASENPAPAKTTTPAPTSSSAKPGGLIASMTDALSRAGKALSPNLESQAQSALKSGDKELMKYLLKQTDSSKPMTAETRAKVEAALAKK